MILNIDNLDSKSIQSLAMGEILAIRVDEFIKPALATKLAKKILAPGYKYYANAKSIGRIGMAFYESSNKPELIDFYFAQAQENIDNLRNRCLPYASPIDILRCKLDEVWPPGANLESLYGNKMFVGLCRVLEPNVYFLPHHDILADNAIDSYTANSILAQFSCNIYLSIPNQGGVLQIWDKEVSSSDFNKMRGDSYGIDPKILDKPNIEVHPKIGEMIVFNSRKIHAILPSVTTQRLSISCFVGYRGNHSPLTFWS